MSKIRLTRWMAILLASSLFFTQIHLLAGDGAFTEVVFETDAGNFTVEVYEDRAPASAADFLAYVDQGLYEGAAFYRTVRLDNDKGSPVIEVIQGGLLDESRALEPIPHESTLFTGIRHTDRTISLARAEPGTGGAAAFFICIGDQPGLDYRAPRNPDRLGFAAFGKVIDGMDTILKIHQMDANAPSESEYTQGQLLTRNVLIISAVRRY
jgi:peptidyl-prolyl cis-trans isomerase A (cyclophilin A)